MILGRLRCALCRLICPDQFFNSDASREIDRLISEVERLRDLLRLDERL
jgi:hypothetical protein